MNSLKLFFIPLIVMSLLSVNQATLVHKRDTLHILSSFARGVSFSSQNVFKIDSINSIINLYPCSLSYKGFFFASLNEFPVCPCCPRWTIGSPQPFYNVPKFRVFHNWPSRLNLQDSSIFEKIDTSNQSYSQCHLPTERALSTYIFLSPKSAAKTTYMLVNVMMAYTDHRKPTITGGGDLGYPVETCTNMLVVDMWLQTDGTTNFQGVQLVSTYDKPKTHPKSTSSITEPPHQNMYDLKGCSVSLSTKRKPYGVPQGCYFVKDGSHLKRVVLITR